MPNSDKQRPTVLEVWLNQTRVGSITNLPYDQNLFVFEESYIRAQDRPLLSLSFYDENRELITEPEQFRTKVPPFFSNLLPEGRLREYLAELAGIKDVREFFLLWLLGADLPGAVIVQDADGRAVPASEQGNEEIREQRDARVLRFSLAGVQLKFSAIGAPGRQLTIPAEGRGGSWIIKLPSQRYPLVPENEYSMMKLAAAVGIDVAEVGLVPTGEVSGLPREFAGDTANSLYVRRFDRTPEGARIHMEDFNQIYRQFPHDKYKHYSYTNMARDISTFLGTEATTEFIRRLVFNAAIGNADMHLKNWSVLYADGRTPSLTPGYDFVSTIRYIEDRKMALSVAHEKDTKLLDRALLERFAEKAGLPKHLVVETAMDTAEKTVRAWSKISSSLLLEEQARAKIEEQLRYMPLTHQFLTPPSAPSSQKLPEGKRSAKRKRPRT